jgi:hypothetical protein
MGKQFARSGRRQSRFIPSLGLGAVQGRRRIGRRIGILTCVADGGKLRIAKSRLPAFSLSLAKSLNSIEQ